MAKNYKTPGVYVEEISVFPPSVAAVETAIPAFIGYTQKHVDWDGSSLKNVPKRITSLLEYETYFGTETETEYKVRLKSTASATATSFSTSDIEFTAAPAVLPIGLLYQSMRAFFDNGGGPCWIVAVGTEIVPTVSTASAAELKAGVEALATCDEPTLLVFPDAVRLSVDSAGFGTVVSAALSQCSTLQDRFTIIDVPGADGGTTATGNPQGLVDAFRPLVSGDLQFAKYGAAYYPYLKTGLAVPWLVSKVKVVANGGLLPAHVTDDDVLGDGAGTVKEKNNAFYNAARAFLDERLLATLPPSGAIAGVYARVDEDRGVWKAPANVSLNSTDGPAMSLTNDFNDGLNVHAETGKSINAIRAFTGKGTLVWGARTLAGNDNENRYVNVRRFLIFAEESIRKATNAFVFEPNDVNTWVKVKSMIDSFLTVQWRNGALVGEKPDQAFQVEVGLNRTMTADDILNGYMIVQIKLAIVRPAEFVVLQFMQKMQES